MTVLDGESWNRLVDVATWGRLKPLADRYVDLVPVLTGRVQWETEREEAAYLAGAMTGIASVAFDDDVLMARDLVKAVVEQVRARRAGWVGSAGPENDPTKESPMSETTPESTAPDQSSGDTNVTVNGDAEVNTGASATAPEQDSAADAGGSTEADAAEGETGGE